MKIQFQDFFIRRIIKEHYYSPCEPLETYLNKRSIYFGYDGYHFTAWKPKDLQDYFSTKDWYKPQYNDVSHLLNTIERKNVEFIKKARVK